MNTPITQNKINKTANTKAKRKVFYSLKVRKLVFSIKCDICLTNLHF